jgi:outer membrane protein assembly factor BamB
MDDWDQQTSAYSPLLIALIGTHVVGIDRRTGKRIWDWNSEDTWFSRMAIANERIFVAGRDRLVCLAHDSGKRLWDVISPIRIEQTFLVDGNEVVVAFNGEIAAFAAGDGKLLWHDPYEGYGTGGIVLGVKGAPIAHADR